MLGKHAACKLARRRDRATAMATAHRRKAGEPWHARAQTSPDDGPLAAGAAKRDAGAGCVVGRRARALTIAPAAAMGVCTTAT